MLQAIAGQPGLFRDTDTGQIVNLQNSSFSPWEMTFSFNSIGDTGPIRPGAGESWILKRWSILVHPWPRVVDPALKARLIINDLIVASGCLLSVLEPVERMEDADIRERLTNIERRLGMRPEPPHICALNQLVNQNHTLTCDLGVEGGIAVLREKTPIFELLREKTPIFELRLSGLRRGLVR